MVSHCMLLAGAAEFVAAPGVAKDADGPPDALMGLYVLGSLGGSANVEAFKSMMSGFDRKWHTAVERCCKKPKEKFVRAFRKS